MYHTIRPVDANKELALYKHEQVEISKTTIKRVASDILDNFRIKYRCSSGRYYILSMFEMHGLIAKSKYLSDYAVVSKTNYPYLVRCTSGAVRALLPCKQDWNKREYEAIFAKDSDHQHITKLDGEEVEAFRDFFLNWTIDMMEIILIFKEILYNGHLFYYGLCKIDIHKKFTMEEFMSLFDETDEVFPYKSEKYHLAYFSLSVLVRFSKIRFDPSITNILCKKHGTQRINTIRIRQIVSNPVTQIPVPGLLAKECTQEEFDYICSQLIPGPIDITGPCPITKIFVLANKFRVEHRQAPYPRKYGKLELIDRLIEKYGLSKHRVNDMTKRFINASYITPPRKKWSDSAKRQRT